ncbi:MAG TPA: hypothetical protein VHM89_14060 [Acidimicrobiales bacterium]|nr:hypothetical protein [Acidimicrobiales bacterium]
MAETPVGLDLHCIVDNLSAHTTPKVAEFLGAHPHVHMHHTPTHASRLNQVWVLLFSILERRLCVAAISTPPSSWPNASSPFIKDYNRRAAPFR